MFTLSIFCLKKLIVIFWHCWCWQKKIRDWKMTKNYALCLPFGWVFFVRILSERFKAIICFRSGLELGWVGALRVGLRWALFQGFPPKSRSKKNSTKKSTKTLLLEVLWKGFWHSSFGGSWETIKAGNPAKDPRPQNSKN